MPKLKEYKKPQITKKHIKINFFSSVRIINNGLLDIDHTVLATNSNGICSYCAECS